MVQHKPTEAMPHAQLLYRFRGQNPQDNALEGKVLSKFTPALADGGRNSGSRVRLGTRLGEKIDERFDRTEQRRIQVSVGVNAGENMLPRLRHIRLRFVRLTQTT